MSDNLVSAKYHIGKVSSLTSRDQDSRKHIGLADLHLKLDIAESLRSINEHLMHSPTITFDSFPSSSQITNIKDLTR